MKSSFSLFFSLILLVSQTCFGQEADTLIQSKWNAVKKTMQRRSDIVSQLMTAISKSKKADKKLMEETRTVSAALVLYLDSIQKLDSLSMLQAGQKDQLLQQSLAKAMANLENIPDFYKMSDALSLIGQLEVLQSMVRMKRKEYNQACHTGKRHDLEFKAPESDEKAPEIKF